MSTFLTSGSQLVAYSDADVIYYSAATNADPITEAIANGSRDEFTWQGTTSTTWTDSNN